MIDEEKTSILCIDLVENVGYNNSVVKRFFGV